ncbi:heparinase II/III domain-containing protein [Paenibacillus tarimensis]|uniref:heparinase II/III domain-containing protein n=1 Tax=Paenibacillus tarimensis TaxID=416012 RepID=UPI001F476097|nr:heparinase II/III family protein [Paenibacillus tarimensis]MCF2943031.1 heparinase II/III-family protein [Paenibacillus tarimensis]
MKAAAGELGSLRSVLPEVPRLLARGRSWEEERERLHKEEACRSMIQELKAGAEEMLGEQVPALPYSLFRLYGETGSRSEYEAVYFNKRKRLTLFGILAWLEPDNPIYREALTDIIWSVCEEYTWCLPAHLPQRPDSEQGSRVDLGDRYTIDLFAAETAFALSEIMMMNAELLPSLVKLRLRDEVQRRVLSPFLEHGPFGWERLPNNWAAVCAGSVGAAAIYMLDGEAEADRLTAVWERVLPALDAFLAGFAGDGACTEGYSYWQYGFGFYVYAADLLKQRTAGAVDLFASDKVRAVALFQQSCFLYGRKVVNFSDSPAEYGVLPGLTHYLSSLYEDVHIPEASLYAGILDDHCGRWAPAIRNLLWVRGESEGARWQDGSYYLADAQWFIVRSRGGGSAYTFAAKGGHNDEPHNHNDLGHFILSVNGEQLLCDLGSGQYTKAYFGPGRYDILCNGSQGHSVPVVNGQHQQSGRHAQAVVQEAVSSDQQDRFSIQLASAYHVPELEQLTRSFLWNREEAVLHLRDSYKFSQRPESIVERFISASPPMADGAGRLMMQAGEPLILTFREDHLDWQTETIIHKGHYGEEQTFYAIDFTVKESCLKLDMELEFSFSITRY